MIAVTCRVPQGSQWFKFEDYLKPRLGGDSGRLELIFEPASGENVLTIPAIRDMFAVKEAIDAVQTECEGRKYRLSDICWQNAQGAAPTLRAANTHTHGVRNPVVLCSQRLPTSMRCARHNLLDDITLTR